MSSRRAMKGITPDSTPKPGSYNQFEKGFIIAPRPKYVPGSGPPLQPIGLLPPDELNGVIEDLVPVKINNEPSLRYIVTYPDSPLRVSVPPMKILEWVSSRTLEHYHYEDVKKVKAREEDEEAEKETDQTVKVGSRVISQGSTTTSTKGKAGRKRKRSPSPVPSAATTKRRSPKDRVLNGPSIPGGRRRRATLAAATITHISPQRASISGFKRGRGLADAFHSQSETEDEEDLLNHQLMGTVSGASHSRLAVEISRSTSPDPLQAEGAHTQSRSVSASATVSVTISDDSDLSQSNQLRVPGTALLPVRSHPHLRIESVASLSSREAFAAYEKLEHQKEAERQKENGSRKETQSPQKRERHGSMVSKYSNLFKQRGALKAAQTPSISTPKQSSVSTPSETSSLRKSARVKPSPPPVQVLPVFDDEEEAEESEWEVDKLLSDDNRDGVTYYLVKWVGEWDNTWEPSENVASDVKKIYHAEKRKKEKLAGLESNKKPKLGGTKLGGMNTGESKTTNDATMMDKWITNGGKAKEKEAAVAPKPGWPSD